MNGDAEGRRSVRSGWARHRSLVGGLLLCLVAAGPVLGDEGREPDGLPVVDGDGAVGLEADVFDEPDPLFDDFFDDEFAAPSGYPDPLERTNRGTFAFNRQVDRWLLDPITRAYRWAVPTAGRQAIKRMFTNLGSTKTMTNDFLQLEWKDAGVTTVRLVINTTIGILGLFDVAEKWGLEGHESDFGQTLALAGTPSGPYLVLPILGPSNVRDAIGTGIDGFFQPTYYILGPSTLLTGPAEILIYSGSSGISTRDQHYLELKSLEESSVDFYAAMRSGYFQNRLDAIWGRRQGHRSTTESSTPDDPGDEEEAFWDEAEKP